ncbi:M10 family metallopeptidase C-terminal domain-containing protein [Yoonia sp. R2331]|uniref:M10 family metallopeptidase C-terminal domain-containing protein n=1 Tax=Yoonia sp. R2331 TaxID=3237238 RepID=UPI0034E5B8C9
MTIYIVEGVTPALTAGSGDYLKILETALIINVNGDDPVTLRDGGAVLHNYCFLGTGANGAVIAQGDGHRIINFDTGRLFALIGIDYRGADGQIVNLGFIRGDHIAGVALRDATDSVFDNRDWVEGGNFGVFVGDDSHNVLVRNSGEISSASNIGVGFGAQVSDVRLENSGTITGDFAGVQVAAGAGDVEIKNFGTISGTYGVVHEGGGRVLNFGTIESVDLRPAILMVGTDQPAAVINQGTILGDVLINGEGGVFRNGGDVSGSFGSLSTSDTRQTVFNDGIIQGEVFLFGGNDRYIATGAGTVAAVYGGAGNDILKSADAATYMDGGAGRDKITTGAGGGTLNGGAGRDLLFGGDGADVFLFDDVADSAAAQPDVIIGFERGVDVINLAGVAAMPLAFDGTDALRGGGQASVNYVQRADGHLNVWVDVDGDGSRDMRIVVKDTDALDWDDFGLDPLIV